MIIYQWHSWKTFSINKNCVNYWQWHSQHVSFSLELVKYLAIVVFSSYNCCDFMYWAAVWLYTQWNVFHYQILLSRRRKKGSSRFTSAVRESTWSFDYLNTIMTMLPGLYWTYMHNFEYWSCWHFKLLTQHIWLHYRHYLRTRGQARYHVMYLVSKLSQAIHYLYWCCLKSSLLTLVTAAPNLLAWIAVWLLSTQCGRNKKSRWTYSWVIKVWNAEFRLPR